MTSAFTLDTIAPLCNDAVLSSEDSEDVGVHVQDELVDEQEEEKDVSLEEEEGREDDT